MRCFKMNRAQQVQPEHFMIEKMGQLCGALSLSLILPRNPVKQMIQMLHSGFFNAHAASDGSNSQTTPKGK